jgi:hypothetical protein
LLRHLIRYLIHRLSDLLTWRRICCCGSNCILLRIH